MLSRKRIVTWSKLATGLILAVLTAVVVYATNPDGNVTITPMGNGGSNIWGLSKTITYEATCAPCSGTHNTGFTTTAGLTEYDCYDDDAIAAVMGSNETAQSYTLAAECPADASHGAPDLTFYVVDLEHLKIDTVSVEDTKQYYDLATSGYVVITADLTTYSGTLPDGFLLWTGGTAGDTQLERKVSLATPGVTTITCQEGSYGTELNVRITVGAVEINPPSSM